MAHNHSGPKSGGGGRKLHWLTQDRIVKRYREGVEIGDIAQQFCVAPNTVREAINRAFASGALRLEDRQPSDTCRKIGGRTKRNRAEAEQND